MHCNDVPDEQVKIEVDRLRHLWVDYLFQRLSKMADTSHHVLSLHDFCEEIFLTIVEDINRLQGPEIDQRVLVSVLTSFVEFGQFLKENNIDISSLKVCDCEPNEVAVQISRRMRAPYN